MGTIDVLRKALAALECPSGAQACSNCNDGPEDEYCCRLEQWQAVFALRAEIERLEAVEPVAGYRGGVLEWFADWLPTGDVDFYTAPIAPSIPAPTHEQIDEGWIQCGGSGSAYDAWHDGARWAYDLAAKRAQAMVLGG